MFTTQTIKTVAAALALLIALAGDGAQRPNVQAVNARRLEVVAIA